MRHINSSYVDAACFLRPSSSSSPTSPLPHLPPIFDKCGSVFFHFYFLLFNLSETRCVYLLFVCRASLTRRRRPYDCYLLTFDMVDKISFPYKYSAVQLNFCLRAWPRRVQLGMKLLFIVRWWREWLGLICLDAVTCLWFRSSDQVWWNRRFPFRADVSVPIECPSNVNCNGIVLRMLHPAIGLSKSNPLDCGWMIHRRYDPTEFVWFQSEGCDIWKKKRPFIRA